MSEGNNFKYVRRAAYALFAIWAAVFIIGMFMVTKADAAVGLAEVCLDGETGGSGTCPNRAWLRPIDSHAVHSCPANTNCGWGDPETQYRTFGDLPDDALVWVCTMDIEPGPFSGIDPCGNRRGPKPPTPKAQVQRAGETYTEEQIFRWDAPTESVDNEPLQPSEIQAYTIYCNDVVVAELTGDIRMAIRVFETGQYECTITATHISGGVSDHSEPVFFEVGDEDDTPVASGVPKPPFNFTVESGN